MRGGLSVRDGQMGVAEDFSGLLGLEICGAGAGIVLGVSVAVSGAPGVGATVVPSSVLHFCCGGVGRLG